MISNTKQVYYNQLKGKISEINTSENFPSVVLEVGHEIKRFVNICLKPNMMQTIEMNYKIGDKLSVKFFVSSRFKHGRWYSMVNGLEILP
jgi:hypothetical protein|tara:strand:- start:101 stop:370 length:270 start_codon:yes stop_codon:yes gene_type:complete